MIHCPTSFESNTLSTYPLDVKLIRRHPPRSLSITPPCPPTSLRTGTSATPQKNITPRKKVLALFSGTVLICAAVTKAVDNRRTLIGRTARNQEPDGAIVAAAAGSRDPNLAARV